MNYAVTVILDPSLYVPPGELTAPPVSAVIVSVYLLGAGGVTTSSSLEQEEAKRRNNELRTRNLERIVFRLSLKINHKSKTTV